MVDKARRDEISALLKRPDVATSDAYRYARGVIVELLRSLDAADVEIYRLRRALQQLRCEMQSRP